MRPKRIVAAVMVIYPVVVALVALAAFWIYPDRMSDIEWGYSHLDPAMVTPTLVLFGLPIAVLYVIWYLPAKPEASNGRGFEVTRGEK